MLDALVGSGALPPVEERLPAEPFVETMVDGIDTYGGTLRTTILAGGDHYNITRLVANETLVRWTPDWTEVVPSIARAVEASEGPLECRDDGGQMAHRRVPRGR